MRNEFLLSNHDKSSAPVYQTVPHACIILLQEIHQLEGIIVSGSYAEGSYQKGDRIVVDILFKYYPASLLDIMKTVKDAFIGMELDPVIRNPLARKSITDDLRKGIYSGTFSYALRSQEVANEWGIPTN